MFGSQRRSRRPVRRIRNVWPPHVSCGIDRVGKFISGGCGIVSTTSRRWGAIFEESAPKPVLACRIPRLAKQMPCGRWAGRWAGRGAGRERRAGPWREGGVLCGLRCVRRTWRECNGMCAVCRRWALCVSACVCSVVYVHVCVLACAVLYVHMCACVAHMQSADSVVRGELCRQQMRLLTVI